MNAAKIIKLAPTLVLVGFLGYSSYSTGSGAPEAAEMQEGFDRMVQEVFAEGSTAAAKLEGKLRDPFWVATAKPTAKESTAKELPGPSEADELAEIVRGMTLGATFLQGRDQLAVIDGRIYRRGQQIAIPQDDSTPGRSMQVVAVTRTGVLLRGGDKHYSLGYPDLLGKKKEEDGQSESAKERAVTEIDPGGQMEMFQRLLNSPLGAMGKSMVGDPKRSKAASGRRTAQRDR